MIYIPQLGLICFKVDMVFCCYICESSVRMSWQVWAVLKLLSVRRFVMSSQINVQTAWQRKTAAVSLDEILFPVGRYCLRLWLCPRSPAKTDTHTLAYRHLEVYLWVEECEVGSRETLMWCLKLVLSSASLSHSSCFKSTTKCATKINN